MIRRLLFSAAVLGLYWCMAIATSPVRHYMPQRVAYAKWRGDDLLVPHVDSFHYENVTLSLITAKAGYFEYGDTIPLFPAGSERHVSLNRFKDYPYGKAHRKKYRPLHLELRAESDSSVYYMYYGIIQEGS